MNIRQTIDSVRKRLGSLLGPGELASIVPGRARAGNTKRFQAADHREKRKKRRQMARESRRRNRT